METKIIKGNILEIDEFNYIDIAHTMILDIPWKYDNDQGGSTKRGGIPYEQMDMDDIYRVLDVIDVMLNSDSATLFMWHTWTKQDMYARATIYLMDTIGFQPVTGLPWLKTKKDDITYPRYLTGYHLGSCSELCTIFRRGKVTVPDIRQKPLGLIAGRVFKHSQKPKSIYRVAQRYDAPYVNVFPRKIIPGWINIGDFK